MGEYTKASEYTEWLGLNSFLRGDDDQVYRQLKRSIQVLFKDSTLQLESKIQHLNGLIPFSIRDAMLDTLVEKGFRTWKDFFQIKPGKKRATDLLRHVLRGVEGMGSNNSDFVTMVANLSSLLQLVSDARDVKSAILSAILEAMKENAKTADERNLYAGLMKVQYEIVRDFVMKTQGPLEVKLKPNYVQTNAGTESYVTGDGQLVTGSFWIN